MLQAAVAGYAEVPSASLDPTAFDAPSAARLSDADRRLLELCRMLVQAIQPGEGGGPLAAPAFLLDLERVFERYIERGLRAGLPAGSLEVQREFAYHGPVPAGQPALTGRPDFIVLRERQVRCVLDAKWKALDGPPPAADVHQALAYAAGLGCGDVRLVYPGRRYRAWRYEMTSGTLVLTVHTLRVTGDRTCCARSVDRLRRALA
jgi:5-methylcytosine-specific restriction enzyme subunit McrC